MKRVKFHKVALNTVKLLEQLNVEYIVENLTAERLKVICEVADISKLCEKSNFIVCIGGDGTILKSVHKVENPPPLLGVNAGTVGFLTEISERGLLWAFRRILEGRYFIDKRFRAEVFFDFSEQRILVLNEAVFVGERPFKVFNYRVLVDNEMLYEDRGDGVIVATPTGSTAYTLSAGGPILDPRLYALIVCPLCSYNPWTRPIVIKGESTITIFSTKREGLLICDGIDSIQVPRSGKIHIYLSDKHCIRFIRFSKNPFRKIGFRLRGV